MQVEAATPAGAGRGFLAGTRVLELGDDSAAAGVLLALPARDRDGAGQQVDVSAQECVALLPRALELPQYAFGARTSTNGSSGSRSSTRSPDGCVVSPSRG